MDDAIKLGRWATIPADELQIRVSRSSGPGGQHANVTASRVEVSIELATCSGLSDEQRRRLIARFGPRVTASAQDTRSQARNRTLALERLERRLVEALTPVAPRTRTKPTRASVQRRLEAKRRQSAAKRTRRRPDSEPE